MEGSSMLLAGMTERQKLAVSLRVSDRMPLSLIALRIATTATPPGRQRVLRLIRRGLKHIRRNCLHHNIPVPKWAA
jgi:hypothetical protein